MKNKKMPKYPFPIIILMVFITSCKFHKEMAYLQDLHEVNNISINKLLLEDYTLQKKDILYVNVKSDYQFESNILDQDKSSSANMLNSASLYYTGYEIDNEGTISIPILGKIHAENKTTTEVQKEIQIIANTIIKEAYVSVKLVNFNISVLGEVKRPGSYNVLANENSFLKIIALSGDLSDYANRKNILLLRQENDTLISHRIDLTSKEFLATGDFFLRPNDIIYVEPVKTKGFRILISDYSVALSAFTSTLTAVLLLINLSIIKQ